MRSNTLYYFMNILYILHVIVNEITHSSKSKKSAKLEELGDFFLVHDIKFSFTRFKFEILFKKRKTSYYPNKSVST